MKKTIQFPIYPVGYSSDRETPSSVSSDLYEELIERWPELRDERFAGLQVDLEVGSSTLKELLDFLRLHGRVPKWTRFPEIPIEPGMFPLRGKRIFDPEEIEEAPYCSLFPEWPIAEGQYDDDDTLVLLTKSIKKKSLGHLSGLSVNGAFCTGALKQQMEAEGFSGLQFRAMMLRGSKPPTDGIWQLWSDVTMPAMLNRLVDGKGGDYIPEANNGCTIDDLYIPFQFRYRKAELQQLQSFDIALTREHLGFYRKARNQPKLIVSKRFRKWCDAQKLQILWKPIAMEENPGSQ